MFPYFHIVNKTYKKANLRQAASIYSNMKQMSENI